MLSLPRPALMLLLTCLPAWPLVADSPALPPTELINTQLSLHWAEAGLTPAREADDGEWCRRVYIDLLGRLPRLGELDAFLKDRHRDRDQRLIARLLYESDYQDEFVDHWADYWTVVLVGRSERGQSRLMDRDGLRQYLTTALTENRPYDEMMFELVTARGSSSPNQSDFNGAVNFLMLKVQDDAVRATTKTAQVFLGTQIQCMQCHDHPFNSFSADGDWSQAQFWGFNSFFRQAVALRRFQSGSRRVDHGELADQDFPGEGKTPDEAEVYFSQRDGILRAAYPMFLDGTQLDQRSGYVDDVVRRVELAQWMRNSPMLEQALVNRMWAYFLGFGLVTPVDDFGPHNPPSHPELLEGLSAAFRASGFDFRQLISWIVLSDPYRLSSRARRNSAADDPTTGQTPQFSRFYLRQMRPETLYAALVMSADPEGRIDPPDAMPRDRWLGQFVMASENDERTETTIFDGTIPQTLMMFNGQLVERATRLGRGSLLQTVIREEGEPTKAITRLYRTALSRDPTAAELKMAERLMAARARDSQQPSGRDDNDSRRMNPMAAGLQDVWWVLLNSSEFLFVH